MTTKLGLQSFIPRLIAYHRSFYNNMKLATGFAGVAAVAATLFTSVSAASYDTIPDIEVYGQHFFYTNNGSQLYGHILQASREAR